MISEGLKKVIFNKLYKDLGKAEIINYNGNIWFIDREKKYWYFELQKDGTLWWRYSFFSSFFALFSFESVRFEPIIKDWVEEVLNHKVDTTHVSIDVPEDWVEEVLNHKVDTTNLIDWLRQYSVEEVLNHKVNTTYSPKLLETNSVEEVLNHKVNTTVAGIFNARVEEVLNYKVDKTASSLDKWVKEILKCAPGTSIDHFHAFNSEVEEVLNHKVINMDGGEMIDEESFVNKVLNHKI